jgi:hypothetical protein
MQGNTTTRGPNPVNRLWSLQFPKSLTTGIAFAVLLATSGCASTAPQPVDQSELSSLGFKVMVATTSVQQDWVRNLTPGQINPMQRNGKKYYIYPDAARNQIYVGGPQEYEAYLRNHPDGQQGAQDAANRAYRAKQDDAMRKATARDLSDPFLGASWSDFLW